MPEWIDPESTNFFVTVCCQRRRINQLCLPGVGDAIVSAARFHHEQRRWLVTLFFGHARPRSHDRQFRARAENGLRDWRVETLCLNPAWSRVAEKFF